MKKAINIFLFLVSIACVIIIFYMLIEHTVKMKTLQYDLLIGIILSSIFYYVVDYYPQHRKMLAGYRLIQLPISRTLASIETILSITKSFYDIEGELSNLVLRDWKVMSNENDTTSRQFISYVSSKKNTKCKLKNSYHIPAPVMSPGNLNDVVRSELKNIKRNIDEIFTYESYFADDMKLFEYLTKLRNSFLLEHYISNYNYNYMSDTYEYIYKLQQLYFLISKYNISYYKNYSIIDTSEKALKYQQKYNAGKCWESFNSFNSNKQNIMDETDRSTYYKRIGNEEYIAKEIARDFDTKLLCLKENSFSCDSDVIIVICNIFEFLSFILRKKFDQKNYYSKLVFLVVNLKIVGLFFKTTKIKSVKSLQTTVFFIPSSFIFLGGKMNKENPSVNNIGIIRQEIDKQFNDKYKLSIDI